MMPDKQKRQQMIGQVIMKQEKYGLSGENMLRQAIVEVIAATYDGSQLSLQQRRKIADQLYAMMRGYDVLQPLIDDPQVTEIMVNSPDGIFFEKNGRISRSELSFDDHEHLESFISRYFGQANKLINEQKPMADMRLDDGSRVHAVMKPAAINGPVISIRRFTGIRPELPVLIEAGFITPDMSDYLSRQVADKKNIFICGGTGTGKTTFLNALSRCIPEQERVITVEDSAELNLNSLPNQIRLESRQPGPDGQGKISLSDLIRTSLRLRPDRIIVGEVRGGEAYDMLQAMQTGHPGSMSTGHGNSCVDMLDRLSLMILMNSNLPWDGCKRMVAGSIDIIVHIVRESCGFRKIDEIAEVEGLSKKGFIVRHVFKQENGSQ
jgi:pilus assembly protein CpaF